MNTALLRSICSAVVVSALASTLPAQGLLSQNGQVVLASGDTALPSSEVIGNTSPVEFAAVSANGTIAFRGRLLEPGGGVTVLNRFGLFVGRTGGDVRMVLRASDPAPGLPGITLNSASAAGISGTVRINDNDHILFGSWLAGNVSTADDTALFVGPVGGFQVLVREGDLAPGTAGATFSTAFNSPSAQMTGMNLLNQVLFKSSLTGGDVSGTTNNEGWWIGTPGNLTLVQRKGDVLPTGEVISALGFVSQCNASGMVLIDASLSTTLGTNPATAANDKILFIWAGGALLPVAREGDVAPGTNGATFNTSSNTWSVNCGPNCFTVSGSSLMIADLMGGDVIAGVNDRALYRVGLGGLQMISRKGDLITGAANGEMIGTVNNSSITMTDSGFVMFNSTIVGPSVTTANDTALFGGTAGNIRMIVREGDPAVGVAGGTYDNIVSQGFALMNQRGQAIFSMPVITATGTASTLFSYDPLLGVQMQCTQGDTIVTGSGAQTVSGAFSWTQFNAGNGAAMSMNNDGDFAVTVRFLAPSGSAAIVRGHIGTMTPSKSTASITNGDVVNLFVDAGPAHAGLPYAIAGSASGTSPGFVYGGKIIPLNQDAYFSIFTSNWNSPTFQNTFGTLDANGRATAILNVPAIPALAGMFVHHAVAVLSPNYAQTMVASEPSSLLLR